MTTVTRFASTALVSLLTLCHGAAAAKAPQHNIVVIMSDDQDARLGSLTAQPYVQREMMGQGVTLENHFATVAQCCPSRTSYLRGQAAHNTNLTHVSAPGGGWEKFVASGQSEYYLPHYLKAAGYRTEYIGKMMNGYNMASYHPKPSGWDHSDLLINPYTYLFNNVVMSFDGERPVFYDGYHQTDIITAKAISRIGKLIDDGEPYYIQVAPSSPHTSGDGPTVPCARHMYDFNDAKALRTPNFNPSDHYQDQKPFWVKELPLMNQSMINFVDWQHRSRYQALAGIDEMVEQVVEFLKQRGQMENTYIIYTTDNGFHEGNHRQLGGKGLPYIEDTNIPMIIRGPGIPKNVTSKMPSTHVDMAPTYLEIAGLASNASGYPPFLDGRSLLQEWQSAGSEVMSGNGVAREILNIEFWGTISNAGLPDFQTTSPIYSFKTVRLVGERQAWLYTVWCDSNSTELYDTNADPYELTNLALNATAAHARLMGRLNGLLLVTKSCGKESCRDPWQLLRQDSGGDFANLDEALDAAYDDFFTGLPAVGFDVCMDYQYAPNEGPYYPPASVSLGRAWRSDTDNFPAHKTNGTQTPGNNARQGTLAQKGVSLETIMLSARNVTDDEIGVTSVCGAPDYCGGLAAD
ncbi:arylsulfatase [Xylariaceae sp. FL0804]|nr:arylsulfatase [Xylariaceae sp. FL0804]